MAIELLMSFFVRNTYLLYEKKDVYTCVLVGPSSYRTKDNILSALYITSDDGGKISFMNIPSGKKSFAGGKNQPSFLYSYFSLFF